MIKPMIGFACLNIKAAALLFGVPPGWLMRVAVESTLRNGDDNALVARRNLQTT